MSRRPLLRSFRRLLARSLDHGAPVWPVEHQKWLEGMRDWLLSIGLRESLMEYEVHADDKLAHYARACTDVTFRFPFGQQELLGVAARGNFDGRFRALPLVQR